MKHLFFIALVSLLFAACGASFDEKKLQGTWSDNNQTFIFGNERAFTMRGASGSEIKGYYRPNGSRIELVSEESGTVVGNLIIKSVGNDTLTIEMMSLGTSQIYHYLRQK